jgi:hypothetical protein
MGSDVAHGLGSFSADYRVMQGVVDLEQTI